MTEVAIFVGNPGAGKSSLLNCLAGEVLFQSGVNVGTGLTTVVDTKTASNGKRYGDTPGLDDIDTRAQAAQEINRILRENNKIKLCFVMTLESGRLKPADKTTMQVILDALPLSTNSFSVIINKLEPRIVELFRDTKHYTKLLLQLFAGTGHHTSHLHFVSKDDSVYDKDNAILQNGESIAQLRNAFESAPIFTYFREEVRDIKHDAFEKMREEFEVQINAIKNANQAQLQEMAEAHAAQMERLRADAQAQRDSFERMMDELNENHRRQMDILNKRLQQADDAKRTEDLIKIGLMVVGRAAVALL